MCSHIRSYCATEWPDAADMPSNLEPYSEVYSELTLCNDILLCGCRIVVPVSLHWTMVIKASTDQEPINQCGEPECLIT